MEFNESRKRTALPIVDDGDRTCSKKIRLDVTDCESWMEKTWSEGEIAEDPNLIRLRVDNVHVLRREFEKRIDGYPWRLRVFRTKEKSIEVFLHCDKMNECKLFEDEVEVEVKLVNHVDDSLSIRKEISKLFSYKNRSVIGFFKFPEVIGDSNFIVDGCFIIEAKIYLKDGNGDRFRKRSQPDFFSPSKYSNVILSVEGKDLHVSKQILAQVSDYFEVLFYGDFKKFEDKAIVIEDLYENDMRDALEVIYDTGRGVNYPLLGGDMGRILDIADRYQISKIMVLAEKEMIVKFVLPLLNHYLFQSDLFRLFDLRAHCLSEWYKNWNRSGSEVVTNSVLYEDFSSELKNEINEWIEDFKVNDSNNVKMKIDMLKKRNVESRENIMRKPNLLSPSRFSDVVFVVAEEKIYASKHILANASSYFENLFYSDQETINQTEFVIDDVSSKEFLVVLEMIYDFRRAVDDVNVQFLLKLADRFKITSITDKAEIWLIEKTDLPLHVLLRLSEQYNLEVFKKSCVRKIERCRQIADLEESHSYVHYSSDLKSELLEKMVELWKKGRRGGRRRGRY